MRHIIFLSFLIFISCGKKQDSQSFPNKEISMELFQLKSTGGFSFSIEDQNVLDKKEFNYDEVLFTQSLLKNFELSKNNDALTLLHTPYQEILHCFTADEKAAFKAKLQGPYQTEFEGTISLDTEFRNLSSHNGFLIEEENLSLINLETLEKVFLKKNTVNFLKLNEDFFQGPVCLVLRLNKFIINNHNTSFVYHFSKKNISIPQEKKSANVSKLEQFFLNGQKQDISFDQENLIYPKEALVVEGQFEKKAILPKKIAPRKNVAYKFVGTKYNAQCIGSYSYEGEGVDFVPATKDEKIFLTINDKKYRPIAHAFDYREYQIYLEPQEQAINTQEINFTSDHMIELTERLTYKATWMVSCPKEEIKKVLVPVIYRFKKGKVQKHFLP